MTATHVSADPCSLDALVEAGRAAERDGDRPRARALYEDALFRLRARDEAPLAASLLRWIARTHLDEGGLEAAEEIAGAALLVSEGALDLAGVSHANNLIGALKREQGDLADAERLHLLAREQAREAGDLLLEAMTELNLGTLANIHGDYRAALRRYRASLAIHRSLGVSASMAHALNNLAMLYTDLRRWRAADRTFREALQVCDRLGDAATRARIAGNRIEVLIAQKRWPEARAACIQARRLAVSTGETATLGEVSRHLGVVARETGDWRTSGHHLSRAARIADERGDLLLGAETAREQARLHWALQHHRETLEALNRAHGLFSRLQARRDLAEVDEQLGGLESMFLNIVASWGQSIESADRYTRGHCERVAGYACALAEAAGVEGEVLLWFRMGALLHDVGKIVVPPEILNKPERLTPEERAVIERHPDAGVELIGDIEFPWDIRPMVRHHHEAWDGSGYPAGLSGEAIPLAARILCVADVYDALASDRPYRPAFPHQRTLDIMASEAGTRLDPALFDLFRTLELPSVTTLAAA
jgi:putative nucleotidyltransferase with HDIG domain